MFLKLHEKLHNFRINAGLTQADIAREIGTSTQQYQKYEKGINNISSTRLACIAKLLGLSIADFFDDDIKSFSFGLFTKNQPGIDISLQSDIQLLVSGYQKIQSPVLRQMILDCISSCILATGEN